MASVAQPGHPQREPGAGDVAGASGSRDLSAWLNRAIVLVERHWRWALGVLLALDGVLLLYMGRGTTFFYDDWDFVTHDYGGGLHAMLQAHVGNISVFPIAVYKVLFHLVGLNHYGIFRLVVVVLHLIAGSLIFALASRRIARVPALLATALILFLGAAWEDLLWAFQVGYLLSIVGGLAAFVTIERRDRLGDLLAMAALVLAAGSSSLGIPLMVGIAVELAWRREWRRGWVVVVPIALYLLWYLGYGESEVTSNSLINAPGFAADLAAAASGALIGRSLEWGRPLALLGVLVLLWRLTGPRSISARLAGLLATGAALWIVTATARSTISPPETSRYTYLGAVVIVLVGVELLRGAVLSQRVVAAASVLVLFFALTGLTPMHSGATGLRTTSKPLAAELGGLALASAYVSPAYQPDPQRAPQIIAGPYLHTVRAIGSSPGDSPAEIAVADPLSRDAADVVLVAAGAPRIRPLGHMPHTAALAPAPAVSGLASGSQAQHGSCVVLTPRVGAMSATLVLPSGGIALADEGRAPASLAYRRFGEAFDPSPSPVSGHSAVELSFMPDAAASPWQLQVSSMSQLVLCGLLH
jgi:hypothetical protein